MRRYGYTIWFDMSQTSFRVNVAFARFEVISKMTIPPDWPKHPPFGKVTLTQAVLEQMIQSVAAFWVDLENMRCNSFERRSESVQRRLDACKLEL